MSRFFTAHTLFGVMTISLGLLTASASVRALPVDPQPVPEDLTAQVEVMQNEAMRQALGMNDARSAELAAVLKRYKQRQALLEADYRAALAELEGIVNDASSPQLARSVRKVEVAMDALRNLTAEKWHAIKILLTMKQQARYLIYQAALQRALKRRLVEGLANSAAPAARQ